ncbi:MAG TPA: hypothetical protein PLB62_12205, partial [Candidatus Sumerlaeota bacterium]|nr:hypothetical protein [Candidatus Sumerlaeota bacterium]
MVGKHYSQWFFLLLSACFFLAGAMATAQKSVHEEHMEKLASQLCVISEDQGMAQDEILSRLPKPDVLVGAAAPSI